MGRLSWDSETGLPDFSLQDDLVLGKSPTQEQSLLRGPVMYVPVGWNITPVIVKKMVPHTPSQAMESTG